MKIFLFLASVLVAGDFSEQCGSEIHDSSGEITSPLFPGEYMPNTNCTWKIFASPTEAIILNFTSFHLEYEQNSCSYDSVNVYTADSGTVFPTYGPFCGTNVPPVITSTKSLAINFKTDHSGQFGGFSAVYRKVSKECLNNNGGCKHICGRGIDGKHSCSCRSGFVLHPDDHDCREEYPAGKIVQLTTQTHPNGSLIFSWNWREGAAPKDLTAFYFKGTSSERTFQMTLSSLLTNLTVGHLHPYTDYDFALWPVYDLEHYSSEKLGKPLTISARTPASVPTAPKDVSQSQTSTRLVPGQLSLFISGPLAWNSKPVGYKVRWEPADAGDNNEKLINFPDLVSNGELTKYDVNVTLSLKPGRRYHVSASARGFGDFGEILVGPETSATFGTIPLAPTNLTAQIADPTSALLAWNAPSPARRYEVTVRSRNISQGDNTNAAFFTPPVLSELSSRNSVIDDSEYASEHEALLSYPESYIPLLDHQGSSRITMGNSGRNTVPSILRLDGSNLTSSSYSLPVLGLTPDENYAVHIRACAADACSTETSTTFRTPPSQIAAPIITRISCDDTRSIHLQWSYLRPRTVPDVDLEFQVRAYKGVFFQRLFTTQSELTIRNLIPGTEYVVEVRASFLLAPGMRKYSNPTRAVITTWPLVPLAPTLTTNEFETAPNVVAVFWSFVNSTVSHVEVSMNGSSFLNCKTLSACDVVVMHGWNSSFKAGFVKISGLRPYQAHAVSLRGCNDHGCGEATTVDVTTGISEPSEPLGLQLNTVDNVIINLEWEPPIEPAGPLTGYLVSWECENSTAMAATTTECFLNVSGLPTQLEECSFSVCAYNVGDDGGEFYGKTATLNKLWPQN